MAKISKRKAFGRIIPRPVPDHFDKTRDWTFHATKGWRSSRKVAA